MKLYEIKYFLDEAIHSPVFDYIRHLVTVEEQLSVKQSWENGYHLCLFGYLEEQRCAHITHQLEQIQKVHPSPIYDIEEFKQRYLKVAKLTQAESGLDTIFQNDVQVLEKNDFYSFENSEQLHLYLLIHHTFDKHFAQNYFIENQILDIIIQLYPFVQALPETMLHKESGLQSNGYASHLSHYVGLINSLKEHDRDKVRARFDAQIQEDLPLFEAQLNKDNPGLLKDLMNIYEVVGAYVDEGFINFFSPKNYETDIVPYLHLYNERHSMVFKNQETREKLLLDHVSCTNKWILNVLYEKLVLLKIKPIEKFYMNYFYSSLKYDQAALEVR
ncbi:hypothetical protein [Bacillus horti]|uniref:Uncharacterized protein n=1 Tax=Caldalkalibacillus horti TaxID=77523 RepID=A0ABT9W1U0_9BACI|nr:hypothetical protein [Bacillus horti]MDQ0167227.1 hypothetical protein [Bacillus horti]